MFIERINHLDLALISLGNIYITSITSISDISDLLVYIVVKSLPFSQR